MLRFYAEPINRFAIACERLNIFQNASFDTNADQFIARFNDEPTMLGVKELQNMAKFDHFLISLQYLIILLRV